MLAAELLVYFSAFIGPFVQEDAAIVAGATAFLHPETAKMASAPLVLLSLFTGLVVSDLWKFWIGVAGRKQQWAKAMAQKPSVVAISSKIVTHPGKTLMLARFIPGTRIPAYIAAGFFGVSFARFSFWIIVSAALYIAIALVVLRTIGEVAGMKGQLYVGIGLVILIFLVFGGKLVKQFLARKADRESSTTS
jgi:membrane protein DedA with SNARE-associated domain